VRDPGVEEHELARLGEYGRDDVVARLGVKHGLPVPRRFPVRRDVYQERVRILSTSSIGKRSSMTHSSYFVENSDSLLA
jgi:hypothetical protein